ncbi:MAG: type II toxin-antitoxin system RelE/ParE family toxin [Geminicoccaceae bacterium]
MIRSYRDKQTERFANGGRVRSWESFRRQAERRLRILENATCLSDLGALNSNHLERLSGDRAGQFSIRINMQWRICFDWSDARPGAENVEITDYH